VLLGAWLPVVLITVLHYGLGGHLHWVHDVLRRTYYLPIVVGAVLSGMRGGLGVAAVACLVYLPHAFVLEHLADPAAGLEKALEMVIYLGVGGVAGWLSDREARRHAQLRAALAEQRRLTRELARASRLSALGELVAGIAHEIKNPLHALAGTAEVVDPLIPAEAEERRLWELHVSEIGRLGRTAERFLGFARPGLRCSLT
jgi:Signal transduction histidine kinase, nitrogen specific